ncbi:8967_t:CDS:2 [Diversispora eburnea]|uniref:8967_t:CDS:1 n=1 Tax=Diversispora eburnea TaxID=1213867 RepID=A0A9N8ZC50_9GLOM|nr:8967_t:CDS:2 [Diversispora eburnea]
MENFENFERIPLINRESPAKTPEEYPNDITIIPYEYQLRLDGLFFKPNYVIESLPTELKSNIKNEKDNDYKQNSFPNEYTRLADIIPDRWSFEILTKFTVQEYRYYPNYTFYKVSTVNVKMHSFFSSAIDITFNAADNIDPELIEACEYRITWTWFMNGYIWRKCKNSNEQEFIKVSYFKGSTGWGLEFYDSDGNIKYGYTSKTDFWWNQYKR